MKILGIYVVLCLLGIISCKDVSVTEASTQVEKGGNGSTESPVDNPENPEESKDSENLPILPPIILLDFGDDNSTSSDDKPKRTIDDNLGYGYLRNNLLNGKYNYYFPGGKTGTAVSIEESISPFEPKTLIEQSKSTYKTPTTTYHPNVKQSDTLRNHHHQHAQNYVMNHQVFGQRTKLQKYSPPDHFNPQTFSPPPKGNGVYTTIRPDYKTIQNTHSPSTYATSRPIYDTYASTPSPNTYVSTPSPYDAHHQNSYTVQRPYDTATTARPLPADPVAFNIPKYSVENGIRYEHKIVWKYKDGSIATPPTSYMSSYSEYSPQRVNYQNVQRNPQINHQSIGYDSRQQDGRYPQVPQNGGYQTSSYQNLQEYHGSNPVNNFNNQRPAQFPTDHDTRYQHPTASALTYNGASPQNYDFSYQQKYGFRPMKQHQGVRYESLRQTTQYSVDSSNPEYSTTPSTPAEITTPGGVLSPKVLAKYSPEAQKYLSKVFPQNQEERVKEEYPPVSQYDNNNYEDLLSYNPSISQYISDPRSILNARPTYIQAGGSLIPVIILRVDGRPPVQTQPSPSINLKALLQEYLSQYAENSRPAHNHNYQVPSAQNYKEPNSFNDLTQLANVLSRFTQKQEDQRNYPTQKLANHPLEHHSTRYHDKSSYDTIRDQVDSSGSYGSTYGGRIGSKQKVKSVQIIGTS